MKNLNRQQLQKIAINYSPDTDFNEFKRIYKKYVAEPYSYLVIGIAFLSDNPLHFQKNLLESV